MKKVLCLLLAAVLCLGLTGCSSGKVDVNGEWYTLLIEPYEGTVARQPGKLTDLPEELQEDWSGYEATFRKLSGSLTVIEVSDGDRAALMFARKGSSGDWALYWLNKPAEFTSFKDGEGITYWVGDEDDAEPFTYTLSENTLTLNAEDLSTAGEVEVWDKNVFVWTKDDDWHPSQWAFIRVDTVLGDDLRLK